jgi:predicted MPP superfamily phosphohydrolase
MIINFRILLFSENNQQWRKSFHFIQGADTQFGMIETFLQNKTNGNWTEEIELTRAAIKEWNQIKPKFVVICGDLVDDYPGSEPRRSKQLEDFKKVFAELDQNIPLVLLGMKFFFS